jgi:O-antigen/teichoic acid export membrane protein
MKVTTAYLGGLAAAASGQVFPEVARCKSSEEMVKVTNQVLSVYFLVISPVIIVLMGLGPDLMRILFSEEFIPAAALLLIILPADLFRIFSETAGIPLMVIKRLKLSTGMYAVWAVLYVSLAFLFGAKWALTGYALAYLLSQSCYALLVYLAARKTYGFSLTRRNRYLILMSLFAVTINGVVLYYFTDRLAGLLCMACLLLVWVFLFRAELQKVIANILKRRSDKK